MNEHLRALKEAYIETLVCKIIHEWMNDNAQDDTLTIEDVFNKVAEHPDNPFRRYSKLFLVVSRIFNNLTLKAGDPDKRCSDLSSPIIKGKIYLH